MRQVKEKDPKLIQRFQLKRNGEPRVFKRGYQVAFLHGLATKVSRLKNPECQSRNVLCKQHDAGVDFVYNVFIFFFCGSC